MELWLVAIAGALGGGIVSEMARRIVGRFWSVTIDPQIDRLSRARQERRAQLQILSEIAEQFRPNGGGLLERITDIESKLVRNEAFHDQIRATLEQNRVILAENRAALEEIRTDP